MIIQVFRDKSQILLVSHLLVNRTEIQALVWVLLSSDCGIGAGVLISLVPHIRIRMIFWKRTWIDLFLLKILQKLWVTCRIESKFLMPTFRPPNYLAAASLTLVLPHPWLFTTWPQDAAYVVNWTPLLGAVSCLFTSGDLLLVPEIEASLSLPVVLLFCLFLKLFYFWFCSFSPL